MGDREREERKGAHGWVSGLSMNLEREKKKKKKKKKEKKGCKERN